MTLLEMFMEYQRTRSTKGLLKPEIIAFDICIDIFKRTDLQEHISKLYPIDMEEMLGKWIENAKTILNQ